jgi:hypothetical protein
MATIFCQRGLVGTMMICLIPLLGWFALIFIVATPLKALQFIYATGYVPSLITSTFFFSLASKANVWILGFSTSLVSALSCVVWYYSLSWYLGPVEFGTLGVAKLFSGIAAVAGAALLLTFKFDEHVRQLRAHERLRA